MSTLYYLAFLSLVVISFSMNLRTCKLGDGSKPKIELYVQLFFIAQLAHCTDVDYCYKYMINSTIKYGR